jgi:hypothetical protein
MWLCPGWCEVINLIGIYTQWQRMEAANGNETLSICWLPRRPNQRLLIRPLFDASHVFNAEKMRDYSVMGSVSCYFSDYLQNCVKHFPRGDHWWVAAWNKTMYGMSRDNNK